MGQQVKTGKQMPAKFREVGLNFLISLIALVLAIITGGIIIWLFGNNPIEAYKALIQGAFGTPMAFTPVSDEIGSASAHGTCGSSGL